MSSTKPELRKALQRSRMALGAPVRHEQAEAIAASLLEHVNWSEVRNLHCFEPIMRLGEVDLVDFVAALQAGENDVRVYTSRKIGGRWQVVDTDDDKPVKNAPGFDAVIVPMLGFDSRLHRVGYGGGYYDRFLAEHKSAKKIGVCYEAGRVEQIPAKPYDIPLDMIVTEQKIYA